MNPLSMLMSQGGQDEYSEGRWLDSDPYMLLLSKDGEEIISLYEFTDLISANISINDLKAPDEEITRRKQEIITVKKIVKEYFSELLL